MSGFVRFSRESRRPAPKDRSIASGCEEMDQVLGHLGMGRGQQGGTTGSSAMFAPAVEMSERDGQLVVCVDLSGLYR
jgi:hypothetical protein